MALLLSACAAGPETAGTDLTTAEAAKAAEINTRLGVAYMRRGDYERAMTKLQRALDQDPDLYSAHTAIALLYERLNEQEQAGQHYRRALSLRPDDPGSRNNYGRFLCQQGKVEQALAEFERAASDPLYDNREVALANAGLCLLKVERRADAEAYLLQALRANPKLAPALLPMAELRLADGQPLAARGYYQRYLEVAQQTPESLWLGVRIERLLGDRDALGSYELLLRSKYPDSVQTKKLLESEQEQ